MAPALRSGGRPNRAAPNVRPAIPRIRVRPDPAVRARRASRFISGAATCCEAGGSERAFPGRCGRYGPDYAKFVKLAGPPGWPTIPSQWLPDGVPDTKGNAAVFYIHPTTYLERDRWNAPLDDVRRHRIPHQTVPAKPGERVQRRRTNLGAALPPGRLWRVPAEERGRAEGAGSCLWRRGRGVRPVRQGSGRQADHPRRAQPGCAAPRAPAPRKDRRQADREAHRRGLCRRLADKRHQPIFPRSVFPPAPRRIKPAASCPG